MSVLLRRLSIAAALALGFVVSSPALAVHVDRGGLGQVLIFPYYTVQAVDGNPFNTYLSVVNRAGDAKAMRVRFREGRLGKEVAAFNLFLGPLETWTGAIVPTQAGARLLSYDRSCVNGPFVEAGGTPPMRYYDFTDAGYTGAAADGVGAGLERTREGYVEVFEMATLAGASAAALLDGPDCSAFQGATLALQTAAPTGGLSGTLTLINVTKGLDFTLDPIALAQVADRPYYRDAGDPYPDYDAQEIGKVGTYLADGKIVRLTWARGVDAIASVLMPGVMQNEIVLDDNTRSHTDWVITMPLQRFYLADSERAKTYPPSRTAGVLFAFGFADREKYLMTQYDNGAGMPILGIPLKYDKALAWSSTVMGFGKRIPPDAGGLQYSAATSSAVLGSLNAGLMVLGFGDRSTTGTGKGFLLPVLDNALRAQGTYVRISDGSTGTVSGTLPTMPAVGFMVRTFENGFLDCSSATCQGNYGGAFPFAAVAPVMAPN